MNIFHLIFAAIVEIIFLNGIIAVKFYNETQVSLYGEHFKRSGGFPKFPLVEALVDVFNNNDANGYDYNQDTHVKKYECGTRYVRFHPQRMGKIVGGVVVPYGAYPWQVCLFYLFITCINNCKFIILQTGSNTIISIRYKNI